MTDIQEIYTILLARNYAETLFGDLPNQEKDGSRDMRASVPSPRLETQQFTEES